MVVGARVCRVSGTLLITPQPARYCQFAQGSPVTIGAGDLNDFAGTSRGGIPHYSSAHGGLPGERTGDRRMQCRRLGFTALRHAEFGRNADRAVGDSGEDRQTLQCEFLLPHDARAGCPAGSSMAKTAATVL